MSETSDGSPTSYTVKDNDKVPVLEVFHARHLGDRRSAALLGRTRLLGIDNMKWADVRRRYAAAQDLDLWPSSDYNGIIGRESNTAATIRTSIRLRGDREWGAAAETLFVRPAVKTPCEPDLEPTPGAACVAVGILGRPVIGTH